MARPDRAKTERGVVLVVALIMLALLSLLAGMSIRSASALEQSANQARLKALALQAAESALLYCEAQVQANAKDATTGFSPQPAPAAADEIMTWQTLANWDALPGATAFVSSGNLKVVPLTASGDSGSYAYFKRSPECMSQYSFGSTNTFVTTSRGFGPDVGAKNMSAPGGAEVWLQSVVTLN